METARFDYVLPPELIAQEAIEPRDVARLLIVPDGGAALVHRQVRDLGQHLRAGDLLVLNRTRVIPARFDGRKDSGGAVEVLLVHPLPDVTPPTWRCLIGGKVRAGTRIDLPELAVTVTDCRADGHRDVAFPAGTDVLAYAERHGHVPLPPYIARPDRPADRERYQTVFADRPGSVAAPTASLHLTTALLDQLAAQGVERAFVNLAIGPGTFKPVDTDRIEDYQIHAEHAECPAETVAAVAACRARGGRVVAVGTTVVRTLETAARQPGGFAPYQGWTQLFLHPPQRLRIVDCLLTNFHLPRSSLLMLVACHTGVERLHRIYAEAVAARYRFFSYGDAMLLLGRADHAGS
jgi:S-adenosylmethionine:tRNA ribosyltransferase-isomerase